VTLTAAQSGLPAHGHAATGLTISGGGHEHTYLDKSFGTNTSSTGGGNRLTSATDVPTATTGGGAHSHTIGGSVADNAAASAAAAHENMPPFLSVGFIIRT
jgi:microcystin-dependent protein